MTNLILYSSNMFFFLILIHTNLFFAIICLTSLKLFVNTKYGFAVKSYIHL